MESLFELDTTLKELYENSVGEKAEIYVGATLPTIKVQTTKGLPVSVKYAYQDGLWPTQRDLLARLLTQVMPQWLGMIAGKLHLVMFDLDESDSGGGSRQHRADTQQVLSQIAEHQRPTVMYVKQTSDIVLPPTGILAVASPMDCLEHLPAMVPFESHYRALSKRDLAFSTVSTPPSDVVETRLGPDQVQESKLRNAEVTRMLDAIRGRAVPFVAKLPQCRAGFGTFIVRNEQERDKTLAVLVIEVDLMLRQVNQSNEHLRPASLVIQEMIPGETTAISMFVNSDGTPVLTSVTHQLDNNGRWEGSHIDFSRQARLKLEFTPISRAIGDSMRELGYHGPLGADVMTDQNGNHLVVDINARLTSSHLLGLSEGFFSTKRGFHHAGILSPIVDVSLDEFKDMFSVELQEGRMVIAGWCHGEGKRTNVTGIMIAGEDGERLKSLETRVKALESHDCFD